MLIQLIVLLLAISPAWADVITFDATLATDGTITGLVSYDPSNVIGTDIRNLAGNVSYSVLDWNITALPNYAQLPSLLTMTSIELCQGHCIFGSPDLFSLTATDGLHTVRMAWDNAWSPIYNADWLKSVNADGTFNSLIGVMAVDTQIEQGTVPEPETVILLVIGLGMLSSFRFGDGVPTLV